MHTRNEQGQVLLADRREMLRVKWKTLLAEIKYIKLEERKTYGQLQTELAQHRAGLEVEALATLAAYQTIRYGNSYVDAGHLGAKVKAMVEKYGKMPTPFVENAYRPLRCDRVRRRERKDARQAAYQRHQEQKKAA
jgi:hypothetical protein